MRSCAWTTAMAVVAVVVVAIVAWALKHSQSESLRRDLTQNSSPKAEEASSQKTMSTPTRIPIEQTDDYKKGFGLGRDHGRTSANDQTAGLPADVGLRVTAKLWHDNKEFSSLDLSRFQSGYEAGFREAFDSVRKKSRDHVSLSRLTFVNVWRVKTGTKFYGADGNRVGTAWKADTFDGRIQYVEWLTGQVLVETSDDLNHRNWKMLK
jgi:hypothetical protein